MRIALILSACIGLVASGVGEAQGIALTDYKFPRSTSQEAYVNGVLNALGNSADSSEVGYGLVLEGSYRLNYRSLPFSYDVGVLGNVSASKSTLEGSESEEAYSFLATTIADKYLRDDSNLFGYGAASLEYVKLAAMDDAYDPRIDVEVGVGFGRTINATVLKQAIRMNEDFKKYNVITGDIPDQYLLELAAIIDREGEFRSRHGSIEYRKYWYEEMEKVLKESGTMAGAGLGAIGIIRIQEILAEPTAQRWHGWVARAGIGAQLSDFDGDSGDPRLAARFDWTRPVSLALQVTNNAVFNTVFEDDPVYRFQDLFRVDYELSNRIDWYNSAQLNFDKPTADGAENILQLKLRSAYIFYIENKLTFNPGFQFQFVDDGVGDSTWDWALLASVSYRLR